MYTDISATFKVATERKPAKKANSIAAVPRRSWPKALSLLRRRRTGRIALARANDSNMFASHRTNWGRPGMVAMGIVNPAALHPPLSVMSPVPLIVMSFMTMTKQDWPWLDLFTAPLIVTLAFGRYTRPVMSHVGLLPAAEMLTPVVTFGSWYMATPDQGPDVGAVMSRVPPPVGACV